MKEPVTAFLRHLEMEKHASPHTIRAYRRDLADFTRSVGVVGDATARDVRAWLASLHGHGLDAASIGRKLAAVRSLYRFLGRRGMVQRNPAREVRLRFRDDQIARLLEIRWWDWPIETIREHIPRLCSDDIDGFVSQFLSSS